MDGTAAGFKKKNGFDCVRESAVRGKETREVFDEFNNGGERGEGFQLLESGASSLM